MEKEWFNSTFAHKVKYGPTGRVQCSFNSLNKQQEDPADKAAEIDE